MGMPPMGMFPGPMGIPGPGMGPFMPGPRPGLGGFGGPIGPVSNSTRSSHLHSACSRFVVLLSSPLVLPAQPVITASPQRLGMVTILVPVAPVWLLLQLLPILVLATRRASRQLLRLQPRSSSLLLPVTRPSLRLISYLPTFQRTRCTPTSTTRRKWSPTSTTSRLWKQ
jgi:hypothetical protein